MIKSKYVYGWVTSQNGHLIYVHLRQLLVSAPEAQSKIGMWRT